MADELKTDKVNEDSIGATSFGNAAGQRAGSAYFYPTGVLGRFFSRFFATKAEPFIADLEKKQGLAGDTVVTTDVVKPEGGQAHGFSVMKSQPYFPEVEKNRRNRYKQYEDMDTYPEIGATFDIYADDCTQKNIKGDRWSILSDSETVVNEVTKLFRNLKLDRFYWDICRNTVKYGDCFIETVLDINRRSAGIQRIKILNPNYIIRVENEFGYLTDFLQEIPDPGDVNWSTSPSTDKIKYVTLDKNQIVQFRLFTSDPAFYPYGKSIAALAVRIYRSLKLMEDAMLVYRLARAPERRIFYIDVGNMPTAKAEMFIERVKQKFKKEKFYNTNQGGIDSRFNPLSADEDFFVPIKGNQGTKIETLPGAQNLGEVDDVKYFRDKLLASLKVPKDYIVEKDQSPERKANLSQLDVKFARVIQRVQSVIEIGLEKIAKRHLRLKDFPLSLITDLRIQMPDPSDMFTKRKLDIDEQKTRVVQAVKGLQLFSTDTIYKEYYDMSDEEIDRTKEELERELEKQQEMMAAQGGEQAQQPGGAMAGPNMNIEAGGQEANENKPPTAAENTQLLKLSKKLMTENGYDSKESSIMRRILEKITKQSKKNTSEEDI
tara:strand:- start:3120 stop:4928 length:1809 start_codon:yes stop_codon:yes gene_type:complete